MRNLFTYLLLTGFIILGSTVKSYSQYCSAGAYTCDEYISDVQFGSIYNSTGCGMGSNGWSGYSDYTYLSENLPQGSSTTITITNGYPYYSSDLCDVYIDWNQDGDFYGTGEWVYSGSGVGPYSGTITVPPGTPLGYTVMRVRITDGNSNSSDPCGIHSYGEVEDYGIYVTCPANPMVWDSAYAKTLDTNVVFQGQILNRLISVNMVTGGGCTTPLGIDTIYCSTKGTTKTSNIIKAGLFSYDGTPLDTNNRISVKYAPNGVIKFAVPSGYTLGYGINSFIVAYDLKYTASVGDYIDCTFDSVRVNNIMQRAKISNPAGKRKIVLNADYSKFCDVTRYYSADQVGTRRIIFGEIDHSSTIPSGPPAYEFYTGKTATVYRQNTYPLTIYHGVLNTQSAAVFIDYDNDGFFSGNERVLLYTSQAEASINTGNITIPCEASSGIHRMRVVSDEGWYTPPACSYTYYGEVEDYLVNIPEEISPTVTFYLTDSVGYVGGYTLLYPMTNTGGNLIYRWDFDNNGTWDDTAAVGSHIFATAGNKTVRVQAILLGCNNTYSSAIYSSVVKVIVPPSKPKVNFIADYNVVTTDIPVNLTDLTSYGPRSWKYDIEPKYRNGNKAYTIIPSDTVPNAMVLFDELGVYDVTLTACNYKGCDSVVRIGYITCLEGSNMCLQTNSTQRAGYLYDDGGKFGNYSSPSTSSSCGFLIKPKCAQAITISFLDFDVNSIKAPSCPLLSEDNVKVYDGKDNTATPLHMVPKSILGIPLYPNGYTNGSNNLIMPLPPALTAHSGSMYVEFNKNCGAVGTGFEARWSTQLYTPPAPKAIAAGTDTIYTKQKAHLYSISTGYQLDFLWEIDTFNVFTDSSIYYAFQTRGTKKVKLTVNSCDYLDATYKTIVVKDPVALPYPNFTANFLRVTPSDPVTLIDQSDNSVYQWGWSVTPKKFTYVNGTDSTSQNPTLKFLDTGYYSVKLVVRNALGKADTTKYSYIHVYYFCQPASISLNTDIGMSNVVLTNIKGDTLIKQPSYIGLTPFTYYSDIVKPVLYKTGQYPIHLQRNTDFNNITWSVYIDFNQDGLFNGPSEKIANISNFNGTNWTANLNIPASVYEGLTRLRVAANVGILPNAPCGPNFTGEYEDYPIIIKNDDQAPVIYLSGKDTFELNSCEIYNDPGYTAWDDVSGDLSGNVVVSGSINNMTPGFYSLFYNVSDASGNAAKQVKRIVKVLPDIVPPVITLKGNNPDSIPVFTPWTDPGYTATDNCKGVNTSSKTGSVNQSKLGTYNISYTANDKATPPNVANLIRKVVIYDKVKPTIALVGSNPLYHEVNTPYVELGATTNDNYYSTLNYSISGSVDVSKLGSNFLTYCVTDSSGNGPVCIDRTVVVVDKTAPVLTLNSTDTVLVDVYTPYIEAGYSVTDNFYSTKELVITVKGTVNIEKLGDYVIQYYASDPSGNVSLVKTRLVRVLDRTAPTIELVGNSIIYFDRWQDYVEYGVKVKDNFYPEKQLAIHYNEHGTFENTLTQGLYSYTYSVCDPSGNCSSEIFRLIYVNQTTSSIAENSKDLVRFYPNPASEIVNFEVKLPNKESVSIAIYNTLGEKILDVFNGTIDQDQFNVNVKGLSSGIYYVRFTIGNSEPVNKKLMINR